jgi:ribonuclease BN (tRNA processing enzyme)
MGYTFFEQKKKLIPEYQNASTQEIIRARRQQKVIDSIIEKPLISITGDTTHHVFAQSPSILNSEVLVTEVTFFCDKISPERAQHQGHMHIDDLIQYEEALSNTKIVIMHLSARYKTTDVEQIIHNKFSKDIRENIIIIPNEMSI